MHDVARGLGHRAQEACPVTSQTRAGLHHEQPIAQLTEARTVPRSSGRNAPAAASAS
jgi:hypothetical protein